ncbi:PIG-L deacetylase family protein [Antrihabitans cavernicola]|uniref:PIG-L family deacetylase n=1 Tax=Antrihabitans cavernicola TaxID=2495913 RepID=A0A5A7SDR4_9NOCA|nr:PIG-L deacetylase family protein [Spelaeibacter cavernicola]KAA0023332.1 PIG-L family deacetylase [Spelaeibacter cavernicola]
MEPLPEQWQRGLVIAAHPDDIEYGTAAVVARWTEQGKDIRYVLATSGEAGIAGLDPAESGPLRQQEEIRSAHVVGVTEVEFLGHPDGVVVSGPALRRDLAAAIRRHRPDMVVTMHHGLTWGPGLLNSADHRALGISALDAVSDAGNEWIFPELREEGLEPWTSRWAAIANPTPSHAVDVTATFERGVASLSEHKRYLEALDSTPVEEHARRVLDMVAGPIDGFDAAHAVGFELFTFRG